MIYIICTIVGLLFSFIGFLYLLVVTEGFNHLWLFFLVYLIIGSFIWWQSQKGRGRDYAPLLIFPAFIVVGLYIIFIFGIGKVQRELLYLKRNAPEFISKCNDVGAHYYKLPSKPVHSIAYDWNSEYRPDFNCFTMGKDGLIKSMGCFRTPSALPKQIIFTEHKYSYLDSSSLNGSSGPYVRSPQDPELINNEAPFTIDKLSADILVYEEINPLQELKKAQIYQEAIRHDITITDRRNGEKLARLSYVIDYKDRRACGFTDEKIMDVTTFVLRAIGYKCNLVRELHYDQCSDNSNK